MLVLLPYCITGLGLSIGLCSAAGYSGALLVVMLILWFVVGFVGGLLLLVLLIGLMIAISFSDILKLARGELM